MSFFIVFVINACLIPVWLDVHKEMRWKGGDIMPGNTSKRGFASMDPEKQREIARKGGQSSHSGFARMDPEKQREIARKGGEASHGGGRRSSR